MKTEVFLLGWLIRMDASGYCLLKLVSLETILRYSVKPQAQANQFGYGVRFAPGKEKFYLLWKKNYATDITILLKTVWVQMKKLPILSVGKNKFQFIKKSNLRTRVSSRSTALNQTIHFKALYNRQSSPGTSLWTGTWVQLFLWKPA